MRSTLPCTSRNEAKLFTFIEVVLESIRAGQLLIINKWLKGDVPAHT